MGDVKCQDWSLILFSGIDGIEWACALSMLVLSAEIAFPDTRDGKMVNSMKGQ